MFTIKQDDLTSEASRALVALHLSAMHENSPAGHVFALDFSGLTAPDVTFWTAWENDTIVGMGALKELPDGTGEIKSMRTHPDHLRKGVAVALLEHIIAQARERGLRRLSLESGSGPAFDAALELYRKRGFTSGEAFAGYTKSAFNQFFHLSL